MRKCLFILCCFAARLSWADCVDGVRPLTAAEKKAWDEVAAAINAALPAAPPSWKYYGNGWGPEAKDMTPTPCSSSPVGSFFPLRLDITYRWVNPPARKVYPEDAEIKKLEDEITALQVMPPDVRKQYNDVMAQQSEKRRASRAAEKAGNKEEGSKLWKEADEISKGADKIKEDYTASIAPKIQERQAKIKELSARVPKWDTEVHLRLLVNDKEKIPPAGKGLNEDVYAWGSKAPAKPGVAVQNVVLTVSGWPDFREVITNKLDLTKLSGLVK
jgi:hypothetical protein